VTDRNHEEGCRMLERRSLGSFSYFSFALLSELWRCLLRMRLERKPTVRKVHLLVSQVEFKALGNIRVEISGYLQLASPNWRFVTGMGFHELSAPGWWLKLRGGSERLLTHSLPNLETVKDKLLWFPCG
jgi:hypothetical protein